MRDRAISHSKGASLYDRDLVAALMDLFEVPNHPIEIIGWRQCRKALETLASAQELTQGEDMGQYYRIRMDGRDLNYKAYFSEGDQRSSRTRITTHTMLND